MWPPASLITEGHTNGQSWCMQWVGMNTKWLLLEDGHRVATRGGFGITAGEITQLVECLPCMHKALGLIPGMAKKNFPSDNSSQLLCSEQNPEGQWTVKDNKARLQIGRDLISTLQFCDHSYHDCTRVNASQ
uniref:Uncharacterized protein n=1 Tax=Sciurus vulgaris TaxID=55149 RepID=A0A8D2JH67_SCIVU